MKQGDANALRMCLCCGAWGAGLYRLSGGRAVRICQECARNCHGCRNWLNMSTERKPIGREVEWGICDE